jgi:hypothetical protein
MARPARAVYVHETCDLHCLLNAYVEDLSDQEECVGDDEENTGEQQPRSGQRSSATGLGLYTAVGLDTLSALLTNLMPFDK